MQPIQKNDENNITSNPLSVIFYINTFYPVMGGAQTQAITLASQCTARNTKVTIVTRQIKKTEKFEKIDSVNIVRLFCFGGHFLKAITFALSSLLYFFNSRHNFSVIQTFQMDSNALTACIVAKLLNKKAFIRIAGSGVTGEFATHDNLPGKIAFTIIRKLAKGFIVLNNQSRNDLLKRQVKSEKICLLRNGVDTKLHHPVQQEDVNDLKTRLQISQKFILLFVGRLAHPKRLDLLLDVWKSVEDEDSFLFILGKGPDKDKLQSKIIKEKIPRVRITYSSNPADYYRICDIFILLSDAEGTPNALLEAMAHKKIILSSNIPGVNEIIQDGLNGILLKNDQKNIVEKIQSIRKNFSHYNEIKEKTLETILTKYTINKIAKDYLKFVTSTK